MKNSMLLRMLTVSALLLGIAGFSGCSIVSKIENFDNRSIASGITNFAHGQFKPIRSRYFHPAGRLKSKFFSQAILLKDGKILLVSGNFELGSSNSGDRVPEIYDPKTETTVVSSNFLGEDFTKNYNWYSELSAITLQDGRLLFVGDSSIAVRLKAKEGKPGHTKQKQFPTACLVDPKTGKSKFYYDHELMYSAGQLIMKPDGHVLVFSGLVSPYTKNVGNVFEFNPKDEAFETVAHIKDVPDGMPDKPFWLLNNKEQIAFKDELKGRPDTPFWLDKDHIILMGTLDSRHHLVELYNTHNNTSEISTRLSWVFRPKFIAKLPDGTLLESDSINHSGTKFRVYNPKIKQYTDIPGTLHTYLSSTQLSDGNVLLLADEQIALFNAKSKTIKFIDQFNRKLSRPFLITTPTDKVYLLGGSFASEKGHTIFDGINQDVLVFDYKKYLQEHSGGAVQKVKLI